MSKKKQKKQGMCALMFEILTYTHKRKNGGIEDMAELKEMKNWRWKGQKNE